MKYLLLALLPLIVSAAPAPDCSYSFTIQNVNKSVDGITRIAPGPTIPLNNQTQGCVVWSLSYNSTGFTALTLQLESANATAIQSIPDVFSIFGGSTVTGSNPSTVVGSATSTFIGFFPWLRVNLIAYTGTGNINIKLYGWRSPAFI